jgi:hypothetical protein
MEYGTVPVDLYWLASVEAEQGAQYQTAKRNRDQQKDRREQALRAEPREQERGQPDLKRRFRQQEKDREEHNKQRREETERRKLEQERVPRRFFESGGTLPEVAAFRCGIYTHEPGCSPGLRLTVDPEEAATGPTLARTSRKP